MASVTTSVPPRALSPVARLGVLGGTFDPPHRGHLVIGRAARAALSLDHVLVIPAGDPWRKQDMAVTAAEHRLAMATAAVAGEKNFAVTDMEVRRAGPTYTTDTLVALRQAGHAQIWFILGADALMDIPHWQEPQKLIRLARLAVFTRPNHRIDSAALEKAVPGLTEVIDWVPMGPIDLSATALRAQLARAAADDVSARAAVEKAIPAAVLAYIRAHQIYGAEAGGR